MKRKSVLWRILPVAIVITSAAPETLSAETPAQRQLTQIERQIADISASVNTLSAKLGDLQNGLGQLRTEAGEQTRRLQATETAIRDLQGRQGISPEQAVTLDKMSQASGALEATIRRAVDTQYDIAKTELDMSGRIFVIFGVILTLISISVGIGLVVLRMWAENRIKRANEKIDEDLKKKSDELDTRISTRLKEDSIITVGEACAQLALPWWEVYEKDYQSFLLGKIPQPDGFVRNITAAKVLTERGMVSLSQLEKDHIERNANAFLAYAKLLNHWVYHRTAEILCYNELSPLARAEVVEKSEECLTLSRNAKVQGLWANLQQTAAVAMIQLGENQVKDRGRQVLRDILAGKTPGTGFPRTSLSWLAGIWDECFPLHADGVTRTDAFGLGYIPKPT